jgi:hypothetical protein
MTSMPPQMTPTTEQTTPIAQETLRTQEPEINPYLPAVDSTLDTYLLTSELQSPNIKI